MTNGYGKLSIGSDTFLHLINNASIDSISLTWQANLQSVVEALQCALLFSPNLRGRFLDSISLEWT